MVGPVRDVEFRVVFTPVDEDTMRAIEPPGALFSVYATQVIAGLAEPVDIALSVAIGNPNISIAPKGLFIDCD